QHFICDRVPYRPQNKTACLQTVDRLSLFIFGILGFMNKQENKKRITTLFFDFAGVIATSKLFPKLAEIIATKTNISVDEIERALYTDAERFVCGTQSTEGFWEEYLKPLGIEFHMFK